MAVLACGGGAPGRHGDAQIERSCEERKDLAIPPWRDLDLLFVIDDSPSMQDEQAVLAANYRRFMSVLENIVDGVPNLHLAVVSADAAAGGRFQATARGACAPPAGSFISDVRLPDDTRQRNYSGTLTDAFACIALLGAGSGRI